MISDVHRTELLADLGIVFFLFEMGLHINFDTLMSMKRDVFGLGLSQGSTGTVLILLPRQHQSPFTRVKLPFVQPIPNNTVNYNGF